MIKIRTGFIWSAVLTASVVVGCNGKDGGTEGTSSGLNSNAEVGSLSDSDAKKLCEAVVKIAEKEISREVVCTLAGISKNDGNASACEETKSECEKIEHEDSDGRDEQAECAGVTAEIFKGCSATVKEMEVCMKAIIGEVSTITCENPDGRADEAAIEDACKPLLEDPACTTTTEVGHVVAGSGYVHASHVEMPTGSGGTSGSGGSSMGGSDSGSGGDTSASGGMDAGTGGMDAGTGGMDSGTGGSMSTGRGDCTTCSMLECLLAPHRGICDAGVAFCYTEVVDQQAGRQITRGCVTEADALKYSNSDQCKDIESHVLSSGVTCQYACDGPNCNHPPQLLPDQGTWIYPKP